MCVPRVGEHHDCISSAIFRCRRAAAMGVVCSLASNDASSIESGDKRYGIDWKIVRSCSGLGLRYEGPTVTKNEIGAHKVKRVGVHVVLAPVWASQPRGNGIPVTHQCKCCCADDTVIEVRTSNASWVGHMTTDLVTIPVLTAYIDKRVTSESEDENPVLSLWRK